MINQLKSWQKTKMSGTSDFRLPTSVQSEEKYWVSFKEADDYET